MPFFLRSRRPPRSTPCTCRSSNQPNSGARVHRAAILDGMGYEAIDASGGAQLKRQGKLLGVLPAGYRKENGAIIEDPITGPIVRETFHLYASGKHSMRSLADDLNLRGVRTPRNLGRGHNRQAAVIYTDGVLKDLLNNPSYLSRIRLDGELVDGAHPALVDQETFDRCQAIRTRNSKRMKRTFTRY